MSISLSRASRFQLSNLQGWCLVLLLAIATLGLCVPSELDAQNVTPVPYITTIAGNPLGNTLVNGLPATSAGLLDADAVTVDRAGNLYIAEYSPGNRIRVVNMQTVPITVAGVTIQPGTIATVAGNGGDQFVQDTVAATSTPLGEASDVALDGAGNIYIAVPMSQRIRRVDVNGTITTVAGNGNAGYAGDGNLATAAQLNLPFALAVDHAGNLFIADSANRVVRKVDAQTHTISTIVGGGTICASPADGMGDDCLATSAYFNFVTGISLGGQGDLYLADYADNRVRVVNMQAVPITVAGVTIQPGYIAAIAGTGTAGAGTDGVKATQSALNSPYRATVDTAGNVYIADYLNNRVRKVDPNGYISTVVGDGNGAFYGDGGPAASAEVWGPYDVAIDVGGGLLIADYENARIRMVVNGPVPFSNVPVGGSNSQLVRLSFNTSTMLTNAQVTSSEYSPVLQGTCDPSGAPPTMCTWLVTFTPAHPGPRWASFVVTDGVPTKYSFGLHGTGVAPALAFTPGIISTIAGNGTEYNGTGPSCPGDNGPATGAQLGTPWIVAFDTLGNLFISDPSCATVRKVDTNGTITTIAGNGSSTADGISATSAKLIPYGLALDSAGNIYIGDSGQNNGARIRKVDANGIITTVAGNGITCYPSTLACGDGGPAIDAQLADPRSLVVDSAGNIYFADSQNNRVRKVDTNGMITTVAGTGVQCPGTTLACGDGGPATSALFYNPRGLALDNANNLYIADSYDFRIRKVDATGLITTVAGNGVQGYSGDSGNAVNAKLNFAEGVAFDSGGNLYIADQFNDRVRKVDANGIITTVAGTGSQCFPTTGVCGDGGPATSALLYDPLSLTVDGAGNLYVVDYATARIRKVDVSDPPSLTFPSTNVGSTSAAQDVGIENVGNDILNISQIYAPAEFPLLGADTSCNASGQTLNPSFSCILGIEFEPSVGGPISDNIALTSNRLNATQSAVDKIPLNGTGAPQPQSITFPNPGTQIYGVSPFSLTAVATSGLPVSYTVVSGPATVNGSTLTITGVGTVALQATQAGNGSWAGALPMTVNFNVSPATLTFAANNQVMGVGSLGVPPLTYSYYGLVNGDTLSSVVGGVPLLTTSVAINSSTPAGSYPIVVQSNTLALASSNYTLALMNGTFTVNQNVLNFMDNYFVTGDYSAGGVDLHSVTPMSGMVTGTISIAGTPAGADIVNAFLYWQTAENPTTSPSGQAVFNGYSITGNILGTDLPLMGLSWGPLSGMVMRSYRAEVYTLLPRATSGIYQPGGPHTVTLPAPAQGASLVVIYRMLPGGPSGPQPAQYPLKAVIISDGAWLPGNSQAMTQTVQGYYDGVISASANVTSIYSTPSGWVHSSSAKTLQASNGSQYPDSEPTGAWSALVFSVPVNSSDNDGLLDAWKTAGGYCDAGVNQGICSPGDPSWVDLTGATHGQKDLFVQMDYMCSGVVSTGSNGAPTCDTTNGGHSHLPWTMILPVMTQNVFVTLIQQPFLSRGINLHLMVGNAVPEDTCTTDNPATNLFCVWPGETGVVGWKGGFEQIKASPRYPDLCNAGGDCTPRFQVGKKDSYHYVLFGHSVSIPSWSIQAGTLSTIEVLSGGWATVTTSARLPDAYGNIPCPTRVTIDGALATPQLNGVYDVLPMPPATTACPSSTTFTIQTASSNPSAYPVPPNTYPVANGLPEPALAIYSSQTDSTSGYSDVGGGDSIVTLGKFDPTLAPLAKVQAGTLMHELGHSLGLTHGGRYYPNGNVPVYEPNCKPNYQSVMNYLFQFDLLGLPDSTHLYGYLDYSDQALSSLDESNLSPWPGLIAPAFPTETKWFSYSQPPTSNPKNSQVATHCDGTPVGSTESRMWVWDGIPDWKVGSSQDINFDTFISVLDGYSDWASIDPRQVGAFATDYVDIASLLGNGGGHGATGIGGGGHGATGIGGGGHGATGIGGGGHGATGIGGGGHGATGIGGGGHGATSIGGGNQFGEITYETAASYPRSPRGLAASGGTITWYAASFGKIQQYNIYSVTNNVPTLIACIVVTPTGNCSNPVTGDANAITYSYTDGSWSPGVTYLVTTVDIGPAGTLRESTPAKQQQAALHLNPTSSLTYGSSEALSTTGGTTNGSETYYVLSGPCSITGPNLNQLTANSGMGSCVVTATMAGNLNYESVTSATRTVTLQPASTITAISCPAGGVTYTGMPQTPCSATATGPVGLSQTLTVSYSNNTNAGTAMASASYAGDANYLGSSAQVGFTINQASTTTALTATPNPANFGQSVSLVATVAPVAPGAGTPTGTVTFKDGSTSLATATIQSGTGRLTASSLAAGTHNLNAAYSGDRNFNNSSTANLLEQIVCGVLLSISPSTMRQGGTITLTGQVISCATAPQTVVVKFSLSGPLQPNKCGSTKSDIHTTPPFALPAKTSKSVSFPFMIPTGVCPGMYSITVTTMVNGNGISTSTSSLTITAR